MEGLSGSLDAFNVRHSAELFHEIRQLDPDRMNLAVAPVLDDEGAVLDLPEDHRPVAVAADVQEMRHCFT